MLVVIPLSLMWFILAVIIYYILINIFDLSSYGLDELYYQMKKGRQYYGMFSKKQEQIL
jgi:hypothetical protein